MLIQEESNLNWQENYSHELFKLWHFKKQNWQVVTAKQVKVMGRRRKVKSVESRTIMKNRYEIMVTWPYIIFDENYWITYLALNFLWNEYAEQKWKTIKRTKAWVKFDAYSNSATQTEMWYEPYLLCHTVKASLHYYHSEPNTKCLWKKCLSLSSGFFQFHNILSDTPFRNCFIYSLFKNKRTVFLFVCKEYRAQREQPSDSTDSPLSSPTHFTPKFSWHSALTSPGISHSSMASYLIELVFWLLHSGGTLII